MSLFSSQKLIALAAQQEIIVLIHLVKCTLPQKCIQLSGIKQINAMKASKKISLLILQVIFVTSTVGQNRFSVTPSIGFVGGNASTHIFTGELGFQEEGKGILLGITGNYSMTPKWSISTGISYNWIKYHRVIPETSQIKTKDLIIPVLINYQPSLKRLSPYFSTGIIMERIQSKDYSTPPYIKSDVTKGKFPLTLAIALGAGISYKVTHSVSWIIQPSVYYQVYTAQNRTIFPDYRSYKVNLQTQLTLSF
ncbi:hypothetical protein DR864_19130 [Runella rosea]|uniref:Outer membrane protein beta-barrel domain-containing protein n=2 Tax=Runella rosea TaxID=2259595 RepID=A0A344TM28_9BACT|nr:hypothetical protein DR864_19130 [Runella rosea]